MTGEGGNSNLADEILSRGQVDEQPISPIDENKGRLDKLLHNRPKESELVEVGWGAFVARRSFTGTSTGADPVHIATLVCLCRRTS